MSELGAASLGLPDRGPKPGAKTRLQRGIYVLPSLFTVGTLVCGYFAIMSTLRATYPLVAGSSADPSLVGFDNAAKAIGWAILFDALDGRIARLTNSTSDFGREFDSLADVITFGLAPAFLAFAWGTRSVEDVPGTLLIQHMRGLGWIVTFAYMICGAARLARFNIDSHKPATDRRYFIGLPIPGAAGVIAALVHWRKSPLDNWIYGLGWLTIVAILAFLMVCRIRYHSFKAVDLRRRRPYVAIIMIGLVVWGIWVFSEYVLLVLALGYALSGLVLRLASRFRPQPPAPQEVHAR